MLKPSWKWRRVPTSHGAIWHKDDKPEKTTDKPHPLAVKMALLSPLLAIAATVISLVSLRTSQTSMKVGQRAYISVSNARLGMVGMDSDRAISSEFTINNSGNTPATIKSLKFTYKLPDGWESALSSADAAFIGGGLAPPLGTIDLHSQVRWKGNHIFKLDSKAKDTLEYMAKHQDEFGLVSKDIPSNFLVGLLDRAKVFLHINGTIAYSDVFNQSHSTKWCWIFNLRDYPMDCSDQ